MARLKIAPASDIPAKKKSRKITGPHNQISHQLNQNWSYTIQYALDCRHGRKQASAYYSVRDSMQKAEDNKRIGKDSRKSNRKILVNQIRAARPAHLVIELGRPFFKLNSTRCPRRSYKSELAEIEVNRE